MLNKSLMTQLNAIPGLIFMAWAWGKYKCPSCGAVGKNAKGAQYNEKFYIHTDDFINERII